jgi:hypothetical protein
LIKKEILSSQKKITLTKLEAKAIEEGLEDIKNGKTLKWKNASLKYKKKNV